MKITSISGDNLTVERAAYGTTAGAHANSIIVGHAAVPEKRECLFTSARILSVIDSKTIHVDDDSIFLLPEVTEFILYKHNGVNTHCKRKMRMSINVRASASRACVYVCWGTVLC